MDVQTQARKLAATMRAKVACMKDDRTAFEQALAEGADLRSEHNGSVWDVVVSQGACECFKALLPHFNALSGPKAQVIEAIAQGPATGSIPGYSGNMMFNGVLNGAAVIANMAAAAQAEIGRQTRQKNQWEAISEAAQLGASAGEAPPSAAPRRASI
jgi:hypothetical protein